VGRPSGAAAHAARHGRAHGEGPVHEPRRARRLVPGHDPAAIPGRPIGVVAEVVERAQVSRPAGAPSLVGPAASGLTDVSGAGSEKLQTLVTDAGDPSRDGDVAIEFLDAALAPIAVATKGLRYGLFDHCAERMNPGGTTASPSTDPILNEESDAKNFVGSDSRRFHIRVTDPSPTFVATLPNGRRFVEVSWTTTFSNGGTLDQNGGAGTSTISLIEDAPGVFTSRALMHVTTTADQVWGTHCGVAGLYPGQQTRGGAQVAAAIRFPGQTDHRLRRASMFGTSVATYRSSNDVEVKIEGAVFRKSERKRMPVQLLVLWNPATSQPSVDDAGVFDHALRKLREVYERIGVFAATERNAVAEKMITDKIANASKRKRGLDFYYVVPANAGINVAAATQADERALGNQFPDEGKVMRVFFVPGLGPGLNGGPPNAGESYGDDGSSPPLSGALFLANDADPLKATVAHELGHILTDKATCYGLVADPSVPPPAGLNSGGGHFQRPAGAASNAHVHFYNLIGGTRFRLWDVTVTEQPAATCPHGGKHVAPKAFNQIADIFRSPYLR
jgi:ribosomal protein S21